MRLVGRHQTTQRCLSIKRSLRRGKSALRRHSSLAQTRLRISTNLSKLRVLATRTVEVMAATHCHSMFCSKQSSQSLNSTMYLFLPLDILIASCTFRRALVSRSIGLGEMWQPCFQCLGEYILRIAGDLRLKELISMVTAGQHVPEYLILRWFHTTAWNFSRDVDWRCIRKPRKRRQSPP